MIKERLDLLREEFKKLGYAGYLIPSCDEYLSEYVPDYAKRLEYITGFTGSNGIALILEEKALFFTDGRYITQASSELDQNLFEIYDQQLLEKFNWDEVIPPDQNIAYDSKLFTNFALSKFSNLNLKAHNENLVDVIWQEQPPRPKSEIYEYPLEYAGEKMEAKIAKCQNFIMQHDGSGLLITDPISVCWLFNIRASDVEFSPLLLANALITPSKSYLFTDKNRFEKPFANQDIEILPENDFEKTISQITGLILFDATQASDYINSFCKKYNAKSIANPCLLWKACKNNLEIKHMQQAHIQDAVAVCELLSLIDCGYFQGKTEYEIGIKLTELRQKGENYIYDSFPTICGFKENGAIIHYRAKKGKSKIIKGDGMLLIDSGGQYLGATTDITRTVYVGEPNVKHKELYTMVLKGHIALANIKFPANKVTGANLDVLARQYLWQSGLDYAHGTGHGVGSFLSVHEGPQNISLTSYKVAIMEGMVISNEPGYYLPNNFGIRIENMMYAKASILDHFLEFEQLTFVPYEKQLIDFAMLNKQELDYLKSYYRKIDILVKPHLSVDAKKWLEKNQINYS